MFTKEELSIILTLCNSVELKGIDSMLAVVNLALKCKGLIDPPRDGSDPRPSVEPQG